MAITNPINKYDTYLKRMEKGIEQKAFFLDRLGGFKAVLDFLCFLIVSNYVNNYI